jgi:formate/nitrite transporter
MVAQGAFEAVANAGYNKSLINKMECFLLAFHAGLFLSFAGGLIISIAGTLDSFQIVSPNTTTEVLSLVVLPHGIRKFVSGILFPVSLITVVSTGAELFTGNVMYLTAAACRGKVAWKESLTNLAIVYLGNFVGSLFGAYFLFYLSGVLTQSGQIGYMNELILRKIDATLGGEYFLRGIACNYLVCLALWGGSATKDYGLKILALWWPTMTFIGIGFEHCILNMFILPISLLSNPASTATFGQFILFNLIPVTFGNIFGGLMFVLIQWYTIGKITTPLAPIHDQDKQGMELLEKTV